MCCKMRAASAARFLKKCHLFGDVIIAGAVVYAKWLPYNFSMIWPLCVIFQFSDVQQLSEKM